ncbi:hypothetical protein SPBR_05729 [Sporothrix brasiliensis 5110]|uniref:Uncharacterized protein n=1 Tax=Sporothrix brasiliensis 5110 TaxID=1398154 RepID=A0A0C2F6T0_9PEZI|nr:uncharacterized protein SPBR_05729 [Sporothrix brasiliensis 5110]KIH94629.1 hypothetical protein SPBR_05729 [Sporothrix brasiliensis 5110]
MVDLLVEGDGSNGNGNGNAVPTSRPQIPIPQPTSSPRSNIRGPRMIMQERQEREARRAERERMDRAQAEQDARVAAEQRRQAAERERAAAAIAAAAAAASAAPAPAFQSTSQQVDPATQRRQQRAERTAAATSGQLAPPPTIQQQQAPQQPHISSQQQQHQQPPQQQQQAQPRPVRVPQSTQIPQQPINQPPISAVPPLAASGRQPSASGIPDPAPRPSDQTQPQAGLDGVDAGTGGARGQPRNSFPHAFERWEALSAHWEGLTSFWIRQLQQRSEEINQDPLNRQLARQVTDLSAAGANLFHAVVELQRLRASSERKFQRWFFEMRGDMERHTEVQAMLEAAIQEERRGRAEAIREAVENERSNSKIQKQLAEMRKELAISKDEARRAWEELGRREQEERDRVIALQEGQPTIVGGVQVVPMTQGLPLRQHTITTGHEQQQPPPPQPQPQQQPQQPQQPQQVPQQQHQQQAPPPQQVPPQQQKTPLSALEQLPSQTQQRYQASPQQQPAYTRPPVSAAGPNTAGAEYYQQPHGQSDTAPQGSDETYEDYSGQGFAGPGWETIPRHHHPTRLSDVIEEDDERSRTSASQVSRGDRQ